MRDGEVAPRHLRIRPERCGPAPLRRGFAEPCGLRARWPRRAEPRRPRLARTGAHVHSCSVKYRPNSILSYSEKTERNTAFLLYYWLSPQAFGRAPFGGVFVLVCFFFLPKKSESEVGKDLEAASPALLSIPATGVTPFTSSLELTRCPTVPQPRAEVADPRWGSPSTRYVAAGGRSPSRVKKKKIKLN